jgi:hypothetical protein
VVWLGGFGSEDSWNAYKFFELNGRADVAAWRVLLEEPVSLLQVPAWSGPNKIVVEAESFARELRVLRRPIADYLAEILVVLVEAEGGDIGLPGRKIIWDVACISAVADTAAVTIDRLDVPTLDVAGAHDFSRRGREVEVLTDLNAERVLTDMMAALERHPEGKDS